VTRDVAEVGVSKAAIFDGESEDSEGKDERCGLEEVSGTPCPAGINRRELNISSVGTNIGYMSNAKNK